jgi:hypothetical protein
MTTKPFGGKSYGSIGHFPTSRLGPGDHKIADGQARILTERARDPSQDPQGDLAHFILRELLALPPAVLNAPVFRKVKGHLENYRKYYTCKHSPLGVHVPETGEHSHNCTYCGSII